ncbi:uncharacterized protein VTP21DRAFT_2923 [Calcarisporiella thermophila]|uniref:uncharacterized protein n=1 Tax=Calcarisporiella thermophila TaxID=911321 RepID=UPI003743282E
MATAEFPLLKNDLILRAARGEPTERAPVWVMRQAGRYLPEFRQARERNDFFTICRTPELACEVTLQPIDRYSDLLDAAIIFSDILVVPQALGLEVEMLPGKGPHFPNPLDTPADVARLTKDVDTHTVLKYVYDAITLTRHRLNGRVPLLGFAGAPWTLMAYMIEGGGSKTLSKAKTWLFMHPSESHDLLQRVTDVVVDFLVGQVQAGAQMLQIFESWAGELSPQDFAVFSLPYLRQISKCVKQKLGDNQVPMTIFAKGAWFALDDLCDSGYDVVSIDWTIDPESARKIARGRVTLQGNMDPCVLYGGEKAIRHKATEMVRGFGGGKGRYIANLGHGILPTVDPEALRLFFQTVKAESEK